MKNDIPGKMLLLEEKVTEVAKSLVMDVLNEINLQFQDDVEKKYHKFVAQNFLASFIGAFVYKTLMERPINIKSKEAMIKFTEVNFKDCKSKIQEAVSAGFQGAMETYSKKTVEYYCIIKPIPEPTSRLRN